jgi:hypothetical protein
MKIKALFKSKDITITLTEEQIEEINKQVIVGIVNINDINTYEDACKVLGRTPDYELDIYPKIYNSIVLETIIEAVNFIDNNRVKYIPDFNDISVYKYLPYFVKGSSRWSLHYVSRYGMIALCSVGLYFKNRASAEIIANKFIDLYNKVLG